MKHKHTTLKVFDMIIFSPALTGIIQIPPLLIYNATRIKKKKNLLRHQSRQIYIENYQNTHM